jgi:hypothetical protein
MVHPATVSSTSRLDVALPFIFTAAALVLSAPIVTFVSKRIAEFFQQELGSGVQEAPLVLRPEMIAFIVPWAIDVSQAIPTLALPVTSLAILTSGHGLRADTVALYILAIAASLAVFWALAARVYPARYVRVGRWGFSPLTIGGLLFNVAAAGLAYALGP